MLIRFDTLIYTSKNIYPLDEAKLVIKAKIYFHIRSPIVEGPIKYVM